MLTLIFFLFERIGKQNFSEKIIYGKTFKAFNTYVDFKTALFRLSQVSYICCFLIHIFNNKKEHYFFNRYLNITL